MLDISDGLRGQQDDLGILARRHQVAENRQVLLSYHVLRGHHARSLER